MNVERTQCVDGVDGGTDGGMFLSVEDLPPYEEDHGGFLAAALAGLDTASDTTLSFPATWGMPSSTPAGRRVCAVAWF
jgi:hypothetical protein